MAENGGPISKLPYWALLAGALCAGGLMAVDGKDQLEPQYIGVFFVVAVASWGAAWLVRKLRGG